MKHSYLFIGFNLLVVPFIVGCGEGDEFSAQHNQGKDCLTCHGFTSGATVFQSLDSPNYDEHDAARGYSIQLLLDSGKTVKYSAGNGYGNVLYNGDGGEINNFTPQVIDEQGNIINQASTNSHDVGRLACNSCHTQEGLNGAPGRIVNFDYSGSLASNVNTTTPTTQKISFNNDVMPILNTCTGCHGNSGDYSVTDSQTTYVNITSNDFIDTSVAADSLLLLKATRSVSHGGGERFNTSSTQYQTIITWINEGADNN